MKAAESTPPLRSSLFAFFRKAWNRSSKRIAYASYFLLYVAFVAVVEVFFATDKNQLLEGLLPGLGHFVWLFLFLLLLLFFYRTELNEDIHLTNRVVTMLFSDSVLSYRYQRVVFQMYQEEQFEEPLLPCIDDIESFTHYFVTRRQTIRNLIESRIQRHQTAVEGFQELGDFAGQLGLLGTVIGFSASLYKLQIGLKNLQGGGGQVLALFQNFPLHQAFSTTQAACYVVMIALFVRWLTKRSTTRLLHRVEFLQKEFLKSDPVPTYPSNFQKEV